MAILYEYIFLYHIQIEMDPFCKFYKNTFIGMLIRFIILLYVNDLLFVYLFLFIVIVYVMNSQD